MNTISSETLSSQLLALKYESQKNLSKNDFTHLRKIIWTNRLFLLLGFSTAWIFPNPFSMLCISLGLFGQWTIVAHHVCHKGYDKVPGTPARYRSNNFAMGWRWVFDWPDLLYPPAWKYEHNVLHHFHLNENIDPDVAATRIRHYLNPNWPTWLRFTFLCINICAWKITYYSTNVFKAYYEKKNYDHSTDSSKYYKQALIHIYIPYVSLHFIVIPLLFLPLGWMAVAYVVINRLGAEVLCNIHTFLTVVPNHAGSDIPLQAKHFANKEEFYLAQIVGSCNYNTGGFWQDYLQGYLNYQIEHHLYPDLPAAQYRILQPKVKAICLQHGILYKQESIFLRIKKTFRILLMFDTQEA